MVILDRNTKNLNIPRGLGNFVTEGSGGGVTPEEAAQIASAVTEEAISEYDIELQVDLEEIRDAVSGNSQDIAILSGLSTDIAAISGQTTANTQDIGILSGNVETNALAISNLENVFLPELSQAITAAGNLANSANTKVEALSAVTSGLAADISTISGATSALTASVSALSGVVVEEYVLDLGIISGMTTAEKQALWETAEAKYLNGANLKLIGTSAPGSFKVSLILVDYKERVGTSVGWLMFAAKRTDNNSYYGVSFKSDGTFTGIQTSTWKIQPSDIYTLNAATVAQLGGIKVGTGLTIDSSSKLSVKIGEGLGFSGDTLVVSGVSSGPTNYYLNDMSQQELADLYDMLAELTEYDNDSSNIPYIFENYRFFAHTADFDGQQCVQLFFSNWEEQDGNYQLWIGGMLPTKASYPVNIHRTIAVILSDGTLQMNDSNLANIDDAANDFQIRINSNGYIASDMLDRFSSLTKFNRFVFVYQDENIQNNYCAAPLKYFYRKNETVNDEEKLMEYIGVEININGTWYKGDWHFAEYGWSEWNAPDTWTTI